MGRYVIKRTFLALATILIVTILTFFTMNAVPGGPFVKEKEQDPAVLAMLETRYHLDEPLTVQYRYYMGNLVKGDMGISLNTGRPIADTVWSSFAISARLGGTAALSALLAGLLLGMTAALFRNRWPDRMIVFFTNLFVSVPSFILATILLLVFSLKLGLVPVWSPERANYVLPIIALMTYPTAYITRLTKSSMLDVLGQDYIRTARAKGVPRQKIVALHALKNAILPVITYFGPMLAYILTGSLVVETVFTIGGLGSKFVSSITNRDYPMIMGTTIFLAVIMILLNLISDLVYKLVDPRISFS